MDKAKQKGVALLIVLSTIMLLSALVVEFAYQTNVTYNISMNEEERMKAYYLSLSAINFSRIVIKYNKEAQQLVAQASQKLGKNIQVKPLYEMIPINTALIRGLIQAAGSEEVPPAEPAAEEGDKKANDFEAAKQGLSAINTKTAESFLNFEGDFLANIEALDGKIPLNAFYLLTPTQPEYDRLKYTLMFLLRQKSYEGLLKDKVKDSQELATRIADYIDKNDSVNDYGGSERGSEATAYAGSALKSKNAKAFTVDELIFVPGMSDDILQQLKKDVTVYRTDYKINACVASDELLRSMILAFSQNRTDMEPLREDNNERLKNAVTKVREKCPDTAAMATALNEVLGTTGSSASPTPPPPPPPSASGSQPAGGAGAQNSGFAAMLSSDENVFRIEAVGSLGNAEVKIINVLDASNTNPDKWKNLFWRVE